MSTVSSSNASLASKQALQASLKAINTVPVWDMDQKQVEAWIRTTHILHPLQVTPESIQPSEAAKLVQNLFTAVAPLLALNAKQDTPPPSTTVSNGSPSQEPPTKRYKTQHTPSATETQRAKKKVLHDPYDIWRVASGDEDVDVDTIPSTVGALLVQLSTAGWINGLAGVLGGAVNGRLQPLNTSPTATALPIPLERLTHVAKQLQRSITTLMERDFLLMTPTRIYEMVCAHETTVQEFQSIRKRVLDTVVHGKGLHTLSNEDTPNVAVAARHSADASVEDKNVVCKVCDNKDNSKFVLDRKNGDVICTNCGTIAMESIMHEGQQFRKFEGELDRNHHGDAFNHLHSNSHNMSTTLGGVTITSSAGGGGWGSHGKQQLEVVLRNAHAYTEMNVSNFGNSERRTRIGYKDRQKREAFVMMAHVGDALNLHEAVVQRGKELFSGFRNDRELVQQFRGVVAACLCEAFEELSRDGRQILKQKQRDVETRVMANARFNRRNDLHHANMAGKGGLLLDTTSVEVPNGNNGNKGNGAAKSESPSNGGGTGGVSGVETKPASTWDLDDCRSFLLEASRRIAQQWIVERKTAKPGAAKKIPEGTQEELEGKLVEQMLTLCDLLEQELKSRASNSSTKGNNSVVTPRVSEMGHLGIKWQHAHERGSGGKGGVGGSGQHPSNGKPSSRTAGQIFILKTAKKLGSMIKDPVAGEAFHRELRALRDRQEARKRKEMRSEASRQRFQQMQRKPWLQARAQMTS